MYPNPASNEVNISSTTPIQNIAVLSTTRAVLEYFDVEGLELSISAVNQVQGMYWLRRTDENCTSRTLELIIQ